MVRIHTSNPGYWLMHCHATMHALEGMDVVVRVAPEKASKPPPRFAMNCGNYEFTREDFQKYLDGASSAELRLHQDSKVLKTAAAFVVSSIVMTSFHAAHF